MAEVNELSLSNLEGVTTPSISQETTQQVTNDLSLSNLQGVEVVPTTINNELSLSNLDGVESTSITPKTNTTKISSLFTGESKDKGVDRTFIVGSNEPTTQEKIAYGLDKQNMFL